MAGPMISGAYSFLDVLAAMVGPGGSYDVAGMGLAEEAIIIAAEADKDVLTIGAGGAGMHSLRSSKAGRVTIRLLKTGLGNALLSQSYAFQSASSQNWGQNQLTISNPVSLDNITCLNGAFVKHADVTYGAVGGLMEWTFAFTQIDRIMGNGGAPTGLL
jgi:hypothetical protein